MLKKYPVVKWSLIVLAGLIVSAVGFGFWFMSLISSDLLKGDVKSTLPHDIAYVANNTEPLRGKILAVVTSADVMGSSKESTGYELTELARAYYVFKANGFDVDIASTLGGNPPVVIDSGDLGAFDYAFLNDMEAQHKVRHSLSIDQVVADHYRAVYFAGGKGAMFDFPQNEKIQAIVRQSYEAGKVIGAVCHGPAALVNVTLSNGRPLLADKMVSGFTNEEELFLIPDAKQVFPFLLQDGLTAQGARFNAGQMYLENVVKDGQLVTGQNPWSTWKAAESMIEQMGYIPVQREATTEENAIAVLGAYESGGYNGAKMEVERILSHPEGDLSRELIAVHGIVAVMQWDIGKFYDLLSLLTFVKSQSDVDQ